MEVENYSMSVWSAHVFRNQSSQGINNSTYREWGMVLTVIKSDFSDYPLSRIRFGVDFLCAPR